MKRFYSTLLTLLVACSGYAQAVLNELYVIPSPTNHEFFELYNTSTSSTPVPVDGYTLISYWYEDKNNNGFYILDLPNLYMPSHGYLVGSAAYPFNYQGKDLQLGSTATDFSWNDPNLAANYGYVRKWARTKDIDIWDGNPFYDEVAVPANLNDFFSRKSGSGASYNAFLYKDGELVNSFIGGAGGNDFIPDFIIGMPPLNLQNVTSTGNHDYWVNFNSYTTIRPETVIQDVGTDNGYMRESDGLCGAWLKSSSQAFHTPQRTNGAITMDAKGALTIETHITRGMNPGAQSFITYNVTAGPTYMFPVELYIYADNGSTPNVWDASDAFLQENTENIVSDGPFVTYFLPQDQQLILVAKTAPGCYDQVRLVRNPPPVVIALPIGLTMFTGKAREGNTVLEWAVTGNESGHLFEVERSPNGRDFTKVGTVAATAKHDAEHYTFQELLNSAAYYRLRIINKDGRMAYSPIVLVKDGLGTAGKLFVVQNPVETTLVFTYQCEQAEQSTITIYNAVGAKVFSTQKTAQKGFNTYTINLDPKFTSGTYILEVVNKHERSVERFIKR